MMRFLWKRVRLARRQAGLTQVQVAKACGVSQVAISLWESAPESKDHTDPSYESLLALAKVTGRPVEWFLEGEYPDPFDALPEFEAEGCALTADAVAAEADSCLSLGICLTDLSGDPLRAAFVSARDLHAALGSEAPFEDWFAGRLAAYPFLETRDYRRRDEVTGVPGYDLSLEMAQGLALLEVTARGFAAWRRLVELEARLKDEVAARFPPESAAPPPTVPLDPREFVAVVEGCVTLARRMGLAGDRAVRAADRAATELTGRSPLRLLGVEMA